jgi:beta-lactamase regulating signal transducer with metallopeptidase domain
LGRLGLLRARLGGLLRRAEPASGELVEMVGRVAARMGLETVPDARLTDCECSPFVCGTGGGTLVVPRQLALALGAADLESVVAHELAHLKRNDLTWGWIPEIARVVYFFHPVAYWAARQIRLERELACDHLAMLDSGRSAAEYAATLVRVLSTASSPNILRISAAAPLDGGEPRANRAERAP